MPRRQLNKPALLRRPPSDQILGRSTCPVCDVEVVNRSGTWMHYNGAIYYIWDGNARPGPMPLHQAAPTTPTTESRHANVQ